MMQYLLNLRKSLRILSIFTNPVLRGKEFMIEAIDVLKGVSCPMYTVGILLVDFLS